MEHVALSGLDEITCEGRMEIPWHFLSMEQPTQSWRAKGYDSRLRWKGRYANLQGLKLP